MVKVYSSIGRFYDEIQNDSVEANDKGKYAPFFERLEILMEDVLGDERESEIVKLELMDIARGAMQRFATKFKAEGISQDRQLALYEMIKTNVEKMAADVDATAEIKKDVTDHLEETYETIMTAYGTSRTD
jgi:serine/threonine-protein kinase